jgi:hypothetical protein
MTISHAVHTYIFRGSYWLRCESTLCIESMQTIKASESRSWQ